MSSLRFIESAERQQSGDSSFKARQNLSKHAYCFELVSAHALREEFEVRYNTFCDASGDDGGVIQRSRLERTEGPGRPRLQISEEQLEALHSNAGFRWNDVARILNVSSRTLRRRRHELGMQVEGRQYSELLDDQLDGIVGELLGRTPSAGLRLVQGSLNQQGLVVQRARILDSLLVCLCMLFISRSKGGGAVFARMIYS